ncbi:hypothetical protein KY337_00970 [Candidatus Woesearchaeota archaeon]|nr:hypothetical protein [Candidatus Woesearchaeota archaeon]
MPKDIDLDKISKPLDDLLEDCGLEQVSADKKDRPLGTSKEVRFEGNGHKVHYNLGVQKTTLQTTLTVYQEQKDAGDRRLIGFCRGVYDGDTPAKIVAEEVNRAENIIRKYLE